MIVSAAIFFFRGGYFLEEGCEGAGKRGCEREGERGGGEGFGGWGGVLWMIEKWDGKKGRKGAQYFLGNMEKLRRSRGTGIGVTLRGESKKNSGVELA